MKIKIYNTNIYSTNHYYDMMIDNNQCSLIYYLNDKKTILFYGMDSTKSENNTIKASYTIPFILDFDPTNPIPTIEKFHKLLLLK
jgi:hypothetical protein